MLAWYLLYFSNVDYPMLGGVWTDGKTLQHGSLRKLFVSLLFIILCSILRCYSCYHGDVAMKSCKNCILSIFNIVFVRVNGSK